MATPYTIDIDEKSTGSYTTTLLDEDDNAIALADVDSITMTMVDEEGTAINSRSAQNVLNANDCTLHATSGLFTWDIQIEDTTIANTNVLVGNRSIHKATITVTWASGAKQAHREIHLRVLNLTSVS